jgi:hypothetical protein
MSEKTIEELEKRFKLLEVRVQSLERRLDEAGIIEVNDDKDSDRKPARGPARKIIFGVLGIISGVLLPVTLIVRKFRNR